MPSNFSLECLQINYATDSIMKGLNHIFEYYWWWHYVRHGREALEQEMANALKLLSYFMWLTSFKITDLNHMQNGWILIQARLYKEFLVWFRFAFTILECIVLMRSFFSISCELSTYITPEEEALCEPDRDKGMVTHKNDSNTISLCVQCI